MAYELARLGTSDHPLPINDDQLSERVDELLTTQRQRYQRLWTYYRNAMITRRVERDEQGSDRPYRQGQEWGLPSRITGVRCGNDPLVHHSVDGVARKEVVIENDIGWRIDTMVDFLFGQPIRIGSLCESSQKRAQIEAILAAILEQSGGQNFLQQLSMLGAVYGFVDILVKFDPSGTADAPSPRSGAADQPPAAPPSAEAGPVAGAENVPPPQLDGRPTNPGARFLPSLDARLSRIARMVRLEIVEPARALPVLSSSDWKTVGAYGLVYQVKRPGSRRASSPATRGWMSRLLRSFGSSESQDDLITIVELITPGRWARYEDEKLVAEGLNSLGELPLVHIQNLAVPFQYSGTSDVEQLISLQDELNTRLSDRANRITMQSFKMYLGKGIDGFTDLPVAPGRMWMTDNDNADVIEFGGESSSPSEDLHITELREAMDKASGVSPIAAGAIRNRIGYLTSAAALRVTMMALLARTQRKRSLYGDGLERLCQLALAWLDRAGVFHTTPDERRVEIHWPPMIPDAQIEQLREMQIKKSLGVPTDVILRELGYAPSVPSPGTRGEGAGLHIDAPPLGSATEPSP